MKTFAEQLNTIRKERHLTQEQLAQELNVSRTTISRWENGIMLPDIETIKRLSSHLGFNFFQNEDFQEESPEEQNAPIQTDEPAEASPPAEQPTTSAAPTARRTKLFALIAAVLLVAASVAGWLLLRPAEPEQTAEPTSCPIAIFQVRDVVTPELPEWINTNEPAFIYRFSIQNITSGMSFTINKATISYEHPNESGRLTIVYDSDRIATSLGSNVFTPGYGSLWSGAEPADCGFTGVTLTLDGVDSFGNEHSVSSFIKFAYPEE